MSDRTPIIYLAGPIDSGQGLDSNARAKAHQDACDRGFLLYDPATAWILDSTKVTDLGTEPRVFGTCVSVLHNIDYVIANLPPKMHTVGTHIEITIARRELDLPVWVVGEPRTGLTYLGCHYAESIADAFEAISQFHERMA